MTRVRRILLSCLLVIIISFTFYTFSFRPRAVEIRELTKKHIRIAETLKASKEYIAKYRSVKVAFDSLSSQWDIFEEYLPEEQEIPELLREMAKDGKLSRVDFLLFKPLTVIPRDFYKENPIQIKVICGYHELGRFLSRIAAENRLINVSNLRLISSGKPDKTLTADFVATAYSM